MHKKILFVILLVFIFLFYMLNRMLIYIYHCPYTETSSFKYIAKPIKEIYHITKQVENYMHKNKLDIKFVYQNAYGSGFLKNNPIPNDLDYLLCIDLGEYVYDNDNINNIAKALTEKIFHIEPALLLNMNFNKNYYPIKHYLSSNSNTYNKIYSSIRESLGSALSNESYLKISKKRFEYDGRNVELDMIYTMNPHEILLENEEPMIFLAKNIIYNNSMLNYIRELSFVIQYTFTIKKDGECIKMFIVPESALGTKLQLHRKLYVSNTFVGFESLDFINNCSAINDNEEYYFYRMISFRRHLQEAENILLSKERPIKLLKRIMQVADTIQPLLEKDLYKEIGEFVNINLSKEKSVLLNELDNIIHVFYIILTNDYLYQRLNNNQDLYQLYNHFCVTAEKLKKIDIDDEFINQIDSFREDYLLSIMNNQPIDMKSYLREIESIKLNISSICYKNLDLKKIEEYINVYNDILKQAGYHKIEAYWIDSKTIGIIYDDYTKTISDIKDFAKCNDLPDVNYKLITQESTKITQLRHNFLTRYKPTNEEEVLYQKMKETLMKDKLNFKTKIKLVF